MTPMQVQCPLCRTSLRLMVPSLPARVICPHCTAGFTLNPRRPAAAPAAPAPPAAARAGGLGGRLVRAALVLVLLAGFAAGGVALASFCFNGDPPAGTETPSEPRVTP